MGIYRIWLYIIYIAIIIVVVGSPGRDLAASPVKASGEEDEVAAAPGPNADMMRPPRLSFAGVEVGEDAPAAQV